MSHICTSEQNASTDLCQTENFIFTTKKCTTTLHKKQAFLRLFIQRQEKPLYGNKAFAITLGLLDVKSLVREKEEILFYCTGPTR